MADGMLVSVKGCDVIVTWGAANQFRTTYTYGSPAEAAREGLKLRNEIKDAERRN